MSVSVVVEVPGEDASELLGLGDSSTQVARSRGLDGTDIAAVILSLTPATTMTLRTWLLSRVQQRKHSTVVVKGRRLRGYTSDEVIKILELLEKKVSE